ncbi:DUF488 family protein [Streptomyces sp. NPDC097610]
MYEDTSSRNGKRVLVDRRWPRGTSKERAHLGSAGRPAYAGLRRAPDQGG